MIYVVCVSLLGDNIGADITATCKQIVHDVDILRKKFRDCGEHFVLAADVIQWGFAVSHMLNLSQRNKVVQLLCVI